METKFDEYLEFPCSFSYKVIGHAHDDLLENVVKAVQIHAPGDYAPTIRPSSKGTYHSVSINVTVTDKAHIEALYTELGNVKGVIRVL